MPDVAIPDLPALDLVTLDLATPDLSAPDFATPDFATPDLATPDLARPDFATPDLATPDLFMCPGDGGALCGSSCVDRLHDTSNCGACGHVCVGSETCSAGFCSPKYTWAVKAASLKLHPTIPA